MVMDGGGLQVTTLTKIGVDISHTYHARKDDSNVTKKKSNF